jgi:hypothetical protein
LTARNLDELLREQRAARDQYRRNHPEDVAELASLVAAAARQ